MPDVIIITTFKEAREYLSKKRDNIESTVENAARTTERVHPILTTPGKNIKEVVTSCELDATEKVLNPDLICESENSTSQRAEYFSTINRHPKTDAVEV